MHSPWRATLFPVTVIVVVAVALVGIGVLATRDDASPGIEILLPTQTPTAELAAYITGEVQNPGVYTIESDFRIADLVRAAGGATADADLELINLSQRIGDGAHVQVPRIGSPIPPPIPGATGMINVNLAASEQLQLLSGIGPALALAILDYRETNGPFLRLEDLLLVSGIGPATLERFRHQATVR